MDAGNSSAKKLVLDSDRTLIASEAGTNQMGGISNLRNNGGDQEANLKNDPDPDPEN